MQFTSTTLLALAALLPATSAHLTMSNPKQWDAGAGSGQNQFPLAADGSDFPCQNGTPQPSTETYEPGSTQPLQLLGTAVHGGGSGQMLITYDTNPTKNSVWRVMQSWEGNHPVQADGNLSPADPTHQLPLLNFKVPEGLKSGTAVVAWSWFNHIGNREHYMKCSTVTISGSETSDTAFNNLPTMMKGNDGQTGCTVQPDEANSLKFKNPGPNVIGTGTVTVACDQSEAGGSGSSSGSSGSSDSSGSSGSSSPVATGTGSGSYATPSAVASGVASSAPVATSEAAAPSVVPGESPVSSVAAAVSAPAATSDAAPVATSAAAPIPSSTGTASSGSSGTCTEGAVTCETDGSSWSLCGSGAVHNMGPVPAGMTCTNGQIVAAAGASTGTAAASPAAATTGSYRKRHAQAVRFSPGHMHRRRSHI
jgi:hypothetical protein